MCLASFCGKMKIISSTSSFLFHSKQYIMSVVDYKRERLGMSMRFTFWIMVGIVAISGLSQGMLLPAIAMIFEQEGVSSSINGIHATALYIGILVISPFLEKPMQKFGMKPIIVIGGFLVIISLFFYTNFFILGMVYP